MLVLSRKISEVIEIDGRIRVMLVGIRGDKVRIGIDAPPEVSINRAEIADAIRAHERKDGEQ